MRYIFAVAVLGILAIVAWLWPPASTSADPLISNGYLSFIGVCVAIERKTALILQPHLVE